MSVTSLLAEIWGPILVAVGVGILISPNHYRRVYQDLKNETLAGLLFAMVGMAAALAQIHFHNVWGNFPEIVISLLGWSLFLKSAAFAISPATVEKTARWYGKNTPWIALSAIVCLVLGLYLCWFVYLSI